MDRKFKETVIPEDYSKAMAKQNYILGPVHTARIFTSIFHGASIVLAKSKNTTVPKALVFRDLGHNFLAGAKVEFFQNGDNPSDGRWDYIWTFYEDDLKGADIIEANSNSLVASAFVASASKLYNMKFASDSLSVLMANVMLEIIIGWLKENATETEPTNLILDGVFTATVEIEDGETIMGLVPAGEMKVLVKDDSAIQEI